MVTVRDDPGEEPAVEKRGADNAGFARRKLRAGVEQVRHARQTCPGRLENRVTTGIAVAREQDQASVRQGLNPARLDLFRRKCQQDSPTMREQQGHVLGIKPSDMVCLMNAGFFRRQERPFEVNAEYLRPTACRDSRQCVAVPGSRRGDVGRQDVACPADTRRSRHAGYGLRVGRVIEHHPAGTINLKVDKSRRHDAEARLGVARPGVIDRDNAAIFDFNKLIRKRRPAAARKEQLGMDRITIRHVPAFR